jgi:hypothetical protein
MFLPLLLVPVLEAAAAKAVKPVLVLVEGAIFVLVGSVARPRVLLQQEGGSKVVTMAMCY